MWVFTKFSFVSVVQDRNSGHNLIVRARDKGHLTRLFGKRHVIELSDADYRFRVTVSKKEFAKIMTDYIMQELTYDNFKGAQSGGQHSWHQFLYSVWNAGQDLDGRRKTMRQFSPSLDGTDG